MKCPNCQKEVPEVVECDTVGAMFIVKDSEEFIFVWPAIWGLKKYEGCVMFGRGIDNGYLDAMDENPFCLTLSENGIKEVYYDCPGKEEAWLVRPKGKDWEWERVDETITFSD